MYNNWTRFCVFCAITALLFLIPGFLTSSSVHATAPVTQTRQIQNVAVELPVASRYQGGRELDDREYMALETPMVNDLLKTMNSAGWEFVGNAGRYAIFKK
jgi:hypothetical protein